jgi:hypothetical protein
LVCAGRRLCAATNPTASMTATHLNFMPFRTLSKGTCSEW